MRAIKHASRLWCSAPTSAVTVAVVALVAAGLSVPDPAVAAVEDCAAGAPLSVNFFGLDLAHQTPSAISADGSTVVGGNPDEPAFVWTLDGVVFLPTGTHNGSATDVSGDGSIVVGWRESTEEFEPSEAFVWTSSTGIVGIGYLGDGFQSRAFGISADGSVVVGDSWTTSTIEAFRWTGAGGMVGLGTLPGGAFAQAFDVSADGSVVVGLSFTPPSIGEAFRWTSAGGMVGLGILPGAELSTASVVSPDGSVVVGENLIGGRFETFRWTSSGGMVGLGVPSGFAQSTASGISGDGSIIVGTLWTDGFGSEAAVWDATNGWRTVSDVLTALGVSIGSQLLGATDITPDGCAILGESFDGELNPWVVEFAPALPASVPSLSQVAFVTLAMSLLVALALAARLRSAKGTPRT